MKIVSANYITSAMAPAQYPHGKYLEIAFVGRSNVGKSSLMNAMLNRKGLAKTSSTPGKTRLINFFEINERFYFVDLPGYGYAKVPKTMKVQWNKIMTDYLQHRSALKLVVMILDARHEPSDKDHHMMELLEEAAVPTVIVATKFDKLKQSQRNASLKTIRQSLQLDDDALIVPFSSQTKEGVAALWSVIEDTLSA